MGHSDLDRLLSLALARHLVIMDPSNCRHAIGDNV
jgi:hypothetical protein